VIGAGIRGREIYGQWIARHPTRARVMAVAEPNPTRRDAMARQHGIPPERRYADWRELLQGPAIADVCLITTQDSEHTGPARAAMDAGYRVVLEKPMATSAEDCRYLTDHARKTGTDLQVCHVLRYAPLFQAARRAILDGRIGRVLHVEYSENVAYWHFGHSYVRGPWRRIDESSPLILAKSCHDLDIIHWLVASPVRRVHSFGSRLFFRPESAPAGAPERCTDGCPAAQRCLWYAPRLYRDGRPLIHTMAYARSPAIRVAGRALERLMRGRFYRWPATVVSDDSTKESVMNALQTGPYGRCVFRSDNDQPDQQSVNLEFENGVTASMSLQGFSYLDGRWFRIDGSEGTLQGRFTFAGHRLRLHRHGGRSRLLYHAGLDPGGHSHADSALMDHIFGAHAQDGTADGMKGQGEGDGDNASIAGPGGHSSAAVSLESHLAAFAAERSRREGVVVTMRDMRSDAL
jgi:predicted dehydrogenase